MTSAKRNLIAVRQMILSLAGEDVDAKRRRFSE
jgi:hypothetical protein